MNLHPQKQGEQAVQPGVLAAWSATSHDIQQVKMHKKLRKNTFSQDTTIRQSCQEHLFMGHNNQTVLSRTPFHGMQQLDNLDATIRQSFKEHFLMGHNKQSRKERPLIGHSN